MPERIAIMGIGNLGMDCIANELLKQHSAIPEIISPRSEDEVQEFSDKLIKEIKKEETANLVKPLQVRNWNKKKEKLWKTKNLKNQQPPMANQQIKAGKTRGLRSR